MEKRTPHYHLAQIKEYVIEQGINAFTLTARRNGFALGLSQDELVDVVLTMLPRNFYKSMTSYNDHNLWQDVYHAPLSTGGTAYVKISDPASGHPVIQFKEL